MFVFWLIPFAVAAALALLMTVAIGSNRTLWSLALATIMLGLAQVIADRQPGGIGGGVALTCSCYTRPTPCSCWACARTDSFGGEGGIRTRPQPSVPGAEIPE